MPEDLLSRLQQLENSYYGDKEAARQKQFFDTYGGRFSNNRGIGLAILNELDAQGIDTSAADEAVTQILDELRTECNEIIESIKDVQQDAIENARKVEAIQNVVSDAVAGNPSADAGLVAESPTEPAQVPEDPTISEMDPNAPFDPSAVPQDYQEIEAGEKSAAEEPMPEEPMPEEPAAKEQPTEEPMPENQVPSDIRTKRIERMKSNWGKTRTQKKKEEEKVWKPSQGILDAAKGGR